MEQDKITQKIRFTIHAFSALKHAHEDAVANRHEFVTPEHVLWRIIHQAPFSNAADWGEMDIMEFETELQRYLMTIDSVPEGMEYEAQSSNNLITLMDKALGYNDENMLANSEGCISVVLLLELMRHLEDSTAAYLISKYLDDAVLMDMMSGFYENDGPNDGSNVADDVEYVEYVLDENEDENENEDEGEDEGEEDGGFVDMTEEEMYERMMKHAGRLFDALNAIPHPGGTTQQRREPWEEFVTCVSETYQHHNPLIGREEELERTLQILCRKEKNNPLHIGEPGVGKTAIIYGLAARMASDDVPEVMRGYTIYACDMSTLLAGTSYHGETEKRVKMLMDGLKNRGNCILYIDEIHNIMGANGNSNGTQSVSDMLKPYLEDGSVRFIGSTTYQDYNRHIAKDKSMVRRFQAIDIAEPTEEQTVEIVKGILPHYEGYHHVRYAEDALRYAVEKSARYIADRQLPDKALDVIDEAGAYRRLHPLCDAEGKVLTEEEQTVDRQLVADVLTKVCKINAKALTDNDNSELKDLEERINAEIYGQDEAVKQVTKAVKMAKAGLIPAEKPLASLLFVGPTGVGKTELCRVLAAELGIELVRFDMSEYAEKHTVAKLIGSPAGYVGYDDGGLLTDAIRKAPNCVLLLDEIEKARSDIYNILLQVMDYARLTDNKGNKVDFKNVILVMTSNAGAQYAGQAAIGFGGGTSRGEAMLQTVKKTFRPEFINRLSGTVVFNDMDEHMATLIMDKKLRQLQQMLSKKNVIMHLTDEARQMILKKGYTKQYGAREMERTIQNMLTPLLMDEILFGKLKDGGEVTIAPATDSPIAPPSLPQVEERLIAIVPHGNS